jgi:hypothetical protein
MPHEQEGNTVSDITASHGATPSRYRGLRPPWPKGHSGNPTGRSAEGLPSKTAAIQRHLEAKLASKKGKKTWAERVVDAWVEGAAKGDAASRRDLLERLYPVPQDEAGKRVVLEGLKLELTSSTGERATVSSVRHELPAPSFADSTGKESYGGTARILEPHAPLRDPLATPLLEASPPLLEASDTPTSRSAPDP